MKETLRVNGGNWDSTVTQGDSADRQEWVAAFCYVDGLDLYTALSVEVMAAWARQAKTNSDDPTTWARRLKQLRPFTRWLQFRNGADSEGAK